MPGSEVVFTVDPSIDRMLAGPLHQWLQSRLSSVASTAFLNAPVSKPTPVHPMSKAIQRVPGRLKESIDTRIDGTGTDLVGYVVANAPYALFVHEGTSGPYPIFPRRPAYALAFWSERDGEFVTRGSVMHPGIGSQPFLRNALIAEFSGSAGG